MKVYPRKCTNCGKGMEEGHLWDDCETFCTTDCLTEWLYNNGVCIYTTWEIDDEEVFDEKGNEWTLINNNKDN